VRRAGAAALLAAPLVAWLARAAGWPRVGDGLALCAIAAALVVLARALGVWITLGVASLVVTLLALAAAVGIAPVYGPPVAMNLAFAALFAASWWRRDPLVTRFARLEGAPLAPAQERYCGRLTLVWAAYLALLGVAGIGVALHGNERLGTWWSGIVNYLLIAALFVGELWYRRGSARGVLAQVRNVRDAMRRST